MAQINVFNRKVFLKDLTIATIIILLPFLFYLYLLVPEVKVWETPFFTIESNYYNDVSTFVWTAMTKILTLLILSIWFVTCKYWWRFAILIPIIIEIHKLLIILNNDLFFVDETEILIAIPFTVPIILLLIFLSRKINNYSLTQHLNYEIDEEIKNAIIKISDLKMQNYKIIKSDLTKLKNKKNIIPPTQYMKELIQMKKKLMGLD